VNAIVRYARRGFVVRPTGSGAIRGGLTTKCRDGWLWRAGLLLILIGSHAGIGSAAPQSPLDTAFETLITFDWGPDRAALAPIDLAVVTSLSDDDARRYLEDRLLEVLRGTAPRGAKSYACRQLSVVGTPRSVPVLRDLLDDPELSHMARYALEVIPGVEAGEALREALATLPNELKAGVVQSLGQRGDQQAVGALTALLAQPDGAWAEQVVIALGRIGTRECAAALAAYRPTVPPELEPLLTHAQLRVARQMLDQGDREGASAIYRAFESSPHEHLRAAALQGLLRAEPDRSIARLIAALGAAHPHDRLLAAQIIRERTDDQWIVALTDTFTDLPLPGQVDLLEALHDHPHASVRTVALASLASPDAGLRAAAIRALGSSGEASDVPLLVQLAGTAGDAEREVLAQSLHALRGAAVDTRLIELLDDATPAEQMVVIRALVARQSPGTGPRLLAMARSDDAEVRTESFEALQVVGDGSLAADLVELLANTPAGRERESAERALARCCLAIADPRRRAEPLLSGLFNADASRRAALLPALGRLGGEAALAEIQRALADPVEDVRDAAVRALSNWPDASVADQLRDLARHGDKPAHRIWALRGFVRVIAREGRAEPEKTWEGLREAMELATRVEDQRLVLSRMTATRVPQALELAVACLDDESLREEAIETALSLADAMKESHPAAARAALERVLAMTGNPDLQLHVTKILWNMDQKGL
jgi:HEAT repeat protein